MEHQKKCIGCQLDLDISKFYFNKTNASYFTRCMACSRKMVRRRYHTVERPKRIEEARQKNVGLYGYSSVLK